jgi:hypothetical protein
VAMTAAERSILATHPASTVPIERRARGSQATAAVAALPSDREALTGTAPFILYDDRRANRA